MLHALSARMSKDHGFTNQNSELQLAAVYAADRSVLKDVMTLDRLRSYQTKTKRRIIPETASATSRTNSSEVSALQHEGSDSLADEVMQDLEKLHRLKENFEMMFPDGGKTPIGTIQTSVERPDSDLIQSKRVAKQSASQKTKKERIIELAKALEESKDTTPAGTKEMKKKASSRHNIIEEIASTKQEIEPENEKQKHQLEVIDQFIKTQPSISSKKDQPKQAPEGDLTTIKTGEFSDNIVSETLVEILIKQGKNDKAIEVLKKLIWKFPQKKAYFAAQIAELKK